MLTQHFKTLEYKKGELVIIDQRKLPKQLIYWRIKRIKSVWSAIKTLAVRGAPAIGVAAAYGLCIGAESIRTKNEKIFSKEIKRMARYLNSSRPTAVNLSWAMNRMISIVTSNNQKDTDVLKVLLHREAVKIDKEDKKMCKEIGYFGAQLIRKGDRILTHCNAGALATAGDGTALSALYAAKRQKKNIKVYVDETRPLLQGARLTSWELTKNGIDTTLICDNMAASLMRAGKIDKIMVGADRIARNGDFANKIGTYSLAVLARVHKVPLYVLAPSSTFDSDIKDGTFIPIETRGADEVRRIRKVQIAPEKVKVYNPAFDVTPYKLVTAFVTEKGILKKPYKSTFKFLDVC